MRDEHGRFIKGISGNPKGRVQPAKDIRVMLKESGDDFLRKCLYWLKSSVEDSKSCRGSEWKPDSLDRIICSIIVKAMNGEVRAAEVIFDRVFGKPHQTFDLNHDSSSLNYIIEKIQQLNDKQLIEQTEIATKTLKGEIIDVTND
jgi:hypothetical protein